MMNHEHNLLDEGFSESTKLPSKKAYTYLTIGICLAYLGLVLLDKDTQSLKDIFSLRILPGLLIYGIPAWGISSFLLHQLHGRHSFWLALILALFGGIGLSFGGIILMFTLLESYLN